MVKEWQTLPAYGKLIVQLIQEADMPPTLQELGIENLSMDDRITLAQAIWDSLSSLPRRPLTEAKRDELARRAAEDDARPDEVIPWEDVRAGILDRLGQS